MTFYLGVDPGKSGAIVSLNAKGIFHRAHVMPILGDRIDPEELFKIIGLYKEFKTVAFLEKVHGRPGHGSSGMFNFGMSYGMCISSLAGSQIPYTLIPPRTWQKVMLEGTEKKLDTKKRAAIAAQRLTGTECLLATSKSKKPHEGIVDAFLLARFAYLRNGRADHAVA